MERTESDAKIFVKLSAMMFLQFYIWGAWFVTLFLVLTKSELADIIGDCYATAPIAAILTPLFLGLIADRFFSSEKVMAVLMILGGGLMLCVPSAIEAKNGALVVWLLTGHMLCFMPTIGLGNTIAFSNLARDQFPTVRVWGTIGWIAAGLVTGFLGWSDSLNLLTMAGVLAVILGVFCFTLPNTPPPAAGQPINLRSLLMLDAFAMLKQVPFLIFIICSTLICIPLAYYYSNTSGFLENMGFEQAASAMSIGQMSEIVFMLLIPFFFRRLGVKIMILIGMTCWVARYMLFAFGATDQVAWMLFLGIALHGICYDFFFVTGFMYTDRVAPKELRGQAQSMLIFFTQGLGMYVGYKVADAQLSPVKEKFQQLSGAISSARKANDVGFFEKFGQMFSVSIPEGVNEKLLDQTSELWKAYWMFPALMAAATGVVFMLAFWDKLD